MNKTMYLKKRIQLSFIMLALLFSVFFVSLSHFALEYIEGEFLQAKLDAGLQMASNQATSSTKSDYTIEGYQVYLGDATPSFLKDIPVGNSVVELVYGGKEFAIIRALHNGELITVVWNNHSFEVIEWTMTLIFISTALLGIFVAWLFATHVVKTTIRPLNDLRHAVEKNELNTFFVPNEMDEVGFLADAVKLRDQQLLDFLQREKAFAQDASHELRTPLAVIMGSAEVLQTQLQDRPKSLAHAKRIYNTASQAANLVSALLLMTRNSEIKHAPLHQLGDLLREEVDFYKHINHKKPIECLTIIEENITSTVRPELAKAVFGNLIRNAFQFTSSGTITIHLNASGFFIEDTGVGVSQEAKSRLFESGNHPQENSQNGMGLSLVHRICEKINWSVVYQPLANGGSRFSVYFSQSDNPNVAS